MSTVTTLCNSTLAILVTFPYFRQQQSYHSVRFPVSWSTWKMGSLPGTTVGMGATDEVGDGSGQGRVGVALMKDSIMLLDFDRTIDTEDGVETVRRKRILRGKSAYMRGIDWVFNGNRESRDAGWP